MHGLGPRLQSQRAAALALCLPLCRKTLADVLERRLRLRQSLLRSMSFLFARESMLIAPHFEVFTGQFPFSGSNHVAVFAMVLRGEHPSQPGADVAKPGLDGHMWNLMKACWRFHPEHRPTMAQALAKLPHSVADGAGADDPTRGKSRALHRLDVFELPYSCQDPRVQQFRMLNGA